MYGNCFIKLHIIRLLTCIILYHGSTQHNTTQHTKPHHNEYHEMHTKQYTHSTIRTHEYTHTHMDALYILAHKHTPQQNTYVHTTTHTCIVKPQHRHTTTSHTHTYTHIHTPLHTDTHTDYTHHTQIYVDTDT